MNNNVLLAIDENALDDIMLKLNNDIDSISKLLNDIEMKFYNVKEYFSGDVADEIQTKFKSYSDQYSTIKDNLNTYVNDLMIIKSALGKIDIKNTNFFQEETQNLNSQNQSIDDENDLNQRNIDTFDYQ
jgi:hypothetical protein